MRGLPVALMTVLLAGAVLAGCSDAPAKKDPVEQADFEDLGLEATQTTGVIRGVIVDDAVRPVAGALVSLPVGETNKTSTSADDGAFGFDGLEPGTYFMTVSKAGFLSAQTSAEVVAGVAEPKVVKVLLQVDPVNRPRIDLFHLDGFIQCSVRPGFLGQQCGVTSEDVVHEEDPLSGNTSYIQSEMIWKSTQALGDELSLAIRCLAGADPMELCQEGQWNIVRAEGHSPQIARINRTLIEQWALIDGGNPLTIDLFAFGRSDLDFYNETTVDKAQQPVTGKPCLDWSGIIFPAGTCIRMTGPGLILNQKVDVYSTAFYGFEPREGWAFINDGAPEIPG